MNIIHLPETPGIAGVQAVVQQIKRLQDPDPFAGEVPITIQGTSEALRLALLLRWNEIPGVTLQAN